VSSLSDKIEYYLKQQLTNGKSSNSIIKIQRNKIAKKFNCVPSQINYVLKTRFNIENGYVVESQRGGGGYVKIIKVKHDSDLETIKRLMDKIGRQISQRKTNNILQRLYEEEIITKQERELLQTVFDRRNLSVDLPGRDILRAKMLRSALKILAKNNQHGQEG